MAHDRDLPHLAVETAVTKPAQRRRCQAGQTLPMMMFFMVSLLGVAGLVIDVGGWYLQKRQVQAAADASALAGANQLPAGWSYAQTAAQTEYTNNGKAGDSTTTTNTTDLTANDSVTVSASRVAPGYLTWSATRPPAT